MFFRGEKHLHPTKTDAERKSFLPKFDWDESLLNEYEKNKEAHLLVK